MHRVDVIVKHSFVPFQISKMGFNTYSKGDQRVCDDYHMGHSITFNQLN